MENDTRLFSLVKVSRRSNSYVIGSLLNLSTDNIFLSTMDKSQIPENPQGKKLPNHFTLIPNPTQDLYAPEGFLFNYHLNAIRETADAARDMVPNTLFFHYRFQRHPGGSWKSCHLTTFKDFQGIAVLEALPVMLANLTGENCHNTASTLIELKQAIQLKAKYIQLMPDNTLRMKAYYWLRGPNVLRRKYLRVMIPQYADPLVSLMCVVEKMIREVIVLCNEWQLLIVQQNLLEPQLDIPVHHFEEYNSESDQSNTHND